VATNHERQTLLTEVDEATCSARIPIRRGDGRTVWVTVDLPDLALVAQFRWYELWKSTATTSYALARVKSGGKRGCVLMHRLLLQAPNGVDVDHKNKNGLDNRRANLRLATRSQNRANERHPRPVTGIPYIGIDRAARSDGWKAKIGSPGSDAYRYLGVFDDPESAALAYDAAARELYGEFATVNFSIAEASSMTQSPRRERPRGMTKHGVTGFRKHGCRCEICVDADAVRRRHRSQRTDTTRKAA
jgi:HNH endonuclease